MIYSFSQWILDLNTHQLVRDGEPVDIRRQALKLLAYLVINNNRLVTREEIFEVLWRGKCVGDDSLTTCIKEIRKILGDAKKEKAFIKTRHGLGYQFVHPVKMIKNRADNEDFFPLFGQSLQQQFLQREPLSA